MQFRQGDVFLERINKLPEVELKEVKTEGRVVLAYGEVTGHAHAIYAEPAIGRLPAKLWDAGAERFLQVLERTILQHEEHGAIPLEVGVYRVSKFGAGTQREYHPEEVRSIAD